MRATAQDNEVSDHSEIAVARLLKVCGVLNGILDSYDVKSEQYRNADR